MAKVQGVQLTGGPLDGVVVYPINPPAHMWVDLDLRCWLRPSNGRRLLYREALPVSLGRERVRHRTYLYYGNRVRLCRSCGSYEPITEESRCSCGGKFSVSA